VRPDMGRYMRVSERIMAIFLEFSDLVEPVSIDEAFLDTTGTRRIFGAGAEIGAKIKARILQAEGLTASVGVASNKFVAKIASDLRKPDGLVVVDPGTEKEFLHPLAIRRLWGVGARTEEYFSKMGIERIGQLAEMSREDLIHRLGKGGEHLWHLAQGADDRRVSPEDSNKSIGHETTFEVDTGDAGLLHDTLLELTEHVAQRLRSHRVLGRTIAVKLREADFSTHTRRTTLEVPADTAEKIFPVALGLMRSLHHPNKLVRLIGVYASNLAGEQQQGQLALFAPSRRKDRELAVAVDDITRKFGGGAITRAALVRKKN
jgi:DNA polymerase-4